jgi:hypothetical protein
VAQVSDLRKTFSRRIQPDYSRLLIFPLFSVRKIENRPSSPVVMACVPPRDGIHLVFHFTATAGEKPSHLKSILE